LPYPPTPCTREIPLLPAPTAPSRTVPLCRSRFTFHVSLALTAPWRATTPCPFPLARAPPRLSGGRASPIAS
jgi:hypothetical protein